jgi:hypothetical protein
MLAKMFTRTVQASFHRGNTSRESFGDFGVTTPLLHKGQQGPVLGAELRERVPESIQFLGVDRAGRFGDIFVLFTEWQKNPPQFLTPQLIDAGIPSQPEKPRLELGRLVETVDRTSHLDENLLAKIFDVITAGSHSIDEASDAMLVVDNKLTQRDFVASLRPADNVRQLIR